MGRRNDKQWRRAAATEAKALDAALASLRGCSIRIALLHYSPTAETLMGEEPYLWPALGCDQLAVPIKRHRPHLVLHAHAHEGSPRGQVSGVPVLNVCAQVIGKPLALLDLPAEPAVSSA
jgi:Icc-related predicted phosphoesterase